ncbi:MAG: hypothetical protein ACI4EI_03265 [Muricoprocola sp.]
MFEDFSKKLTDLGNKVMKKTGEVAEAATIQAKILGKKKNIQDAYLALGKAFFEKHKDETTEFADEIVKIHNIMKEVEELEVELKKAKEKDKTEEAETVVKEEPEEKTAEAEPVVEENDEAESVTEDTVEVDAE